MEDPVSTGMPVSDGSLYCCSEFEFVIVLVLVVFALFETIRDCACAQSVSPIDNFVTVEEVWR